MLQRFLPCYRIEELAPDQVFLFSDHETRLLRGKLYFLLAPFLKQGKFTTDELLAKLEKKASYAEIYYALLRLEQVGLLERCQDVFPEEEATFFAHLGISQEDAKKRLEHERVHVISLIPGQKHKLEQALKEAKIRLVSDEKKATLLLVTADDYLNPKLAKISAKNKPWILAKLLGSELWLGPFLQEKSGCWECLKNRVKQNRIEESYVLFHKKKPYFPPTTKTHASVVSTGLHWLSIEVLKHILGKNPLLKDNVLTFNLLTSKIEEHVLVKIPDCSLCGTRTKMLAPLVLQKQKKEGIEDGGFRTISPVATLKKYAHLISPVLGVVKSLTNKFPENGVINVYNAGHNFALSNMFKGVHVRCLRSFSSGKGKTEMQAKAGAFCEAVERYSGLFQGSEKKIFASYKEIEKDAIHPNTFLHFSQKQYENRQEINQIEGAYHHVPHPFSEQEKIYWTPAWSLSETRYKYLPTLYCYYSGGMGYKKPFCKADSNGSAAGNCLEEAILQGFFELVERDAVAMWWYNRLRYPAVDLSSFSDPYIPTLIHEYRKHGREIFALDLTNDLNIPVFAAVSHLKNGKEILFGFGAHMNPEIALLRALTEMNQFLHMMDSWRKEAEKDDLEFKKVNDWLEQETLKSQIYFKPDEKKKMRTQRDFVPVHHDNLLDDIHYCRKIVEKHGMEMLVLDQTRTDIGLPVVKVVVPGLRHFWARYAPGRLYDIPVKMGWLKQPLKEEQLNPIKMFM